MKSRSTYTLERFAIKAANSNRMDNGRRIRILIKIGFLIAPFIIWLAWYS